MNSSNGPIGLFDSGVGGLTVARAIARRLPKEDIEPKAVISFTDLLFNFTILISFLLFHKV